MPDRIERLPVAEVDLPDRIDRVLLVDVDLPDRIERVLVVNVDLPDGIERVLVDVDLPDGIERLPVAGVDLRGQAPASCRSSRSAPNAPVALLRPWGVEACSRVQTADLDPMLFVERTSVPRSRGTRRIVWSI